MTAAVLSNDDAATRQNLTHAVPGAPTPRQQQQQHPHHLSYAPLPGCGSVRAVPSRGTRAAIAKLVRVREDNVRLMMIHVFLFTLYQSICQWNLFDAYLSLLAKNKGFVNSNTWVGFAEGITGVTTLVLAVPLGILVDTYDRIRLLHIAACSGLVATVITVYAFTYDDITTLYTNLLLWGVFTELQGTAGEAVFADSIEKGQRSEKFTMKSVLNTCGLSLGPLIMLAMFALFGNNWGLHELHLPLLAGCCFAPLACLPLFMMKDPQPKVDTSLYTAADTMRALRTPLLGAVRDAATPLAAAAPVTPLLRRERLGSTFSEFSELPDTATLPPALLETSAEEHRFERMTYGESWIPIILTVADFITEIGAGMTVRFFPLFFIHDYGLSPTALCAIFCVYPLCISLAMPVCQKLSGLVGRSQASFIFQSFGILMLWFMTSVQSLPLLIVVFMLRGQLQNAVYPVDRSILMDYIPSKHRGKWNSVASLATMTWSGSAVLGGYLADNHDYRFTFIITAAVYSVGLLCYSPLLYLVPRVEGETSHASALKAHPYNSTPSVILETKPDGQRQDLSPMSTATADTVG